MCTGLHWKYNVKIVHLDHHRSSQHKHYLTLVEGTINVKSMVYFWMGGGPMDQRIFGPHTAASPKRPKITPLRVLWVFGKYVSEENMACMEEVGEVRLYLQLYS